MITRNKSIRKLHLKNWHNIYRLLSSIDWSNCLITKNILNRYNVLYTLDTIAPKLAIKTYSTKSTPYKLPDKTVNKLKYLKHKYNITLHLLLLIKIKQMHEYHCHHAEAIIKYQWCETFDQPKR